jgi:hypothetical protein
VKNVQCYSQYFTGVEGCVEAYTEYIDAYTYGEPPGCIGVWASLTECLAGFECGEFDARFYQCYDDLEDEFVWEC